VDISGLYHVMLCEEFDVIFSVTGTSLLTCQSDAGVISSCRQSAPSTESRCRSAGDEMNGSAENDSSAVKQNKVESLKAARTKVTLS